jgi:hypothetical protein
MPPTPIQGATGRQAAAEVNTSRPLTPKQKLGVPRRTCRHPGASFRQNPECEPSCEAPPSRAHLKPDGVCVGERRPGRSIPGGVAEPRSRKVPLPIDVPQPQDPSRHSLGCARRDSPLGHRSVDARASIAGNRTGRWSTSLSAQGAYRQLGPLTRTWPCPAGSRRLLASSKP